MLTELRTADGRDPCSSSFQSTLQYASGHTQSQFPQGCACHLAPRLVNMRLDLVGSPGVGQTRAKSGRCRRPCWSDSANTAQSLDNIVRLGSASNGENVGQHRSSSAKGWSKFAQILARITQSQSNLVQVRAKSVTLWPTSPRFGRGVRSRPRPILLGPKPPRPARFVQPRQLVAREKRASACETPAPRAVMSGGRVWRSTPTITSALLPGVQTNRTDCRRVDCRS